MTRETVEIFVEFRFDAAHYFGHKPKGHSYRRMHGHSYRAVVTVAGVPDPRSGFVIDFARLQQACADVARRLDHRVLNEVKGLERPSVERLAIWIWQRLAPRIAAVKQVAVHRDSCRHGAIYRGVDSEPDGRREPRTAIRTPREKRARSDRTRSRANR